MKVRVLLLAVSCGLSAASAQWLEKTIYLPDSLGGAPDVACLTYDSANNTVYLAGDNCVIAIDGATNQRLARIPIPSGTYALSMCCNPIDNKVYCTDSSGRLTVIDGATNTTLAAIMVGP